MNPFLEKKRKEEEEANPYGPPSPLPSRTTVQGPELGAGLAQTQVQALDPEEQPMEAEKGRPGWHGLLDLAPGLAMAIGSAAGGYQGTPETRAQMNSYMRQAQENENADQRRVANSKARTTAYNNSITRRKQDRARQKEQDAIAAEDRGRRIGAEDLAASRVADDYNPDSAKNQTLKQGIAQTYPKEWAKLTPEQQQAITVKNYEDVMGLPISEAKRQQKVQDDIRTEEEKQHSEYRWDTTKPTVFEGNNYFGGGGGRPPDTKAPANPDAENKFMQDMIAIYGSREKVPPVMATRANSGWEAATSGRMKDEAAIKLRDDLSSDANKDILATRSETNKTQAEDAAAKKAAFQQDSAYSVQRRVRGIDKLETAIKAAEDEFAKEAGRGPDGELLDKPQRDLSGYGLTRMLPDTAVSPQGVRNRQSEMTLRDMKVREATGAVSNVPEEKTFDTILGAGKWNNDADVIAGLKKAKAFLQDQKDKLDAYYPDAASRFESNLREKRAAREEAKNKAEATPKAEPPDKPTIQGDVILFPKNGKMMQTANTPNNRKALGL